MKRQSNLMLISESSAHLIALMMDKNLGVKRGKYSEEVQDAFNILFEMLLDGGFLENYRQKDGTFGLTDESMEDARYAKRRNKPTIFQPRC